MDIGYARVSTGEQTLDFQLDALAKAGWDKAFTVDEIVGNVPCCLLCQPRVAHATRTGPNR